VHTIADEEIWKTAIGFYINAAFIPGQIGGFFLDRLIQSLNTHQRERRIFLTEGMLILYGSRDEAERNYQLQLSYQMLKLTVAQGLFNKYSSLFNKPLNYSPFDSLLIETLISLGQYDKAIAISNVILSSERYPERRLHYLSVLKQLYQKTGNSTRLLKILTTLVPLTYDFDDFRFLSKHLDKAEFESIRTDMYHKAISSMHAREDMFRFVFNTLAEEKDYDKMIRYLPKTQSYESILPWIELLAAYDRDACFNELLKITDIHFNQAARYAAEELASLVMEIYPVEYVRTKLLAHLSKYRYMQSSTYLRVLAQRFEFS
jgi:tetratricopeptide (TPR) repeat protein